MTRTLQISTVQLKNTESVAAPRGALGRFSLVPLARWCVNELNWKQVYCKRVNFLYLLGTFVVVVLWLLFLLSFKRLTGPLEKGYGAIKPRKRKSCSEDCMVCMPS